MKKLIVLPLIASAIIFTGCGGGGGDSSFKQAIVNITVLCTTASPSTPSASDVSTYHELFSGDKVVQDQVGTVVQFYTPVGQNSRVCLESGSAHIVRK